MTWLTAIVGGFLTLPVQLSLDSRYETLIIAFAQFIVAGVYGLLVAYVSSTRARSKQRRWVVLGAWNGAALVALFFIYIGTTWLWTCNYASRYTLVIGSHYSIAASKYIASQDPSMSCSDIIADYGGDTAKVYEKVGLMTRFIILSALYTGVWLLAASFVLLVAYALAPSSTPARR